MFSLSIQGSEDFGEALTGEWLKERQVGCSGYILLRVHMRWGTQLLSSHKHEERNIQRLVIVS